MGNMNEDPIGLPEKCGDVEKPKDPPNPGDLGSWICTGGFWVWMPAS